MSPQTSPTAKQSMCCWFKPYTVRIKLTDLTTWISPTKNILLNKS